MIQAQRLTKRYGHVTAVDRAEFTVHAGRVTGLLGPYGAGKSTTMRLVLGLDRPSAGQVTIGGRRYRDLAAPLREVGALLDPGAAHGGRSAHNHLLCLARSNGIPRRRVREVIEQVGLDAVAGRPAGCLSVEMDRRLGVAGALLGDPDVLIFDEPVDGLDAEGFGWLRALLRGLAREGRTVFVSDHLMARMVQLAEHLLVMHEGRILADTSVRQFVADNAADHVRVRSPQVAVLAPALAQRGWKVEIAPDRSLAVYGTRPAQIGEVAWEAGAHLHELTEVRPSVEEAYRRLTGAAARQRAADRTGDRAGDRTQVITTGGPRPGGAGAGSGPAAAPSAISGRPGRGGPAVPHPDTPGPPAPAEPRLAARDRSRRAPEARA